MTDVIGINCRVLGKTKLGVGRYTLELVDALAARATTDDLSYLVFGLKSLPERLTNRPAIENADEPAWTPSGPKAQVWEQVALPRVMTDYDVDLLHTPAGSAPVLGSVPKVTTIHDLSPIRHPEWFSKSFAVFYRALTPATAHVSEELIAVSEFTADELRNRYSVERESVHAIPHGVTPPVNGPSPEGVNPTRRYLLFVGSVNPRKNISGVVKAYRKYRAQAENPADLLLVGPEKDVFAGVDIAPVTGVQRTGYVSDAELGWLYRNALSLVYPSLYEGFGLPILEAMSVGTPVVTSDRGAMAEIADGAALLASPEDINELVRALVRIDEDSEYREALTVAGRERASEFTWEGTAARTAEVYRRGLGG
jgi:glycosyltransferase involved in cell wall biosynthesis